MSMDLHNHARRDAAAAQCTLRVEAVFRDVDDQHVEALAAAMIDRAHELANQPAWACDVDVSVQWGSGGESAGGQPGGAQAAEPAGGP